MWIAGAGGRRVLLASLWLKGLHSLSVVLTDLALALLGPDPVTANMTFTWLPGSKDRPGSATGLCVMSAMIDRGTKQLAALLSVSVRAASVATRPRLSPARRSSAVCAASPPSPPLRAG